VKHLLIVHTESRSRRRHFEAVQRYGAKVFLIKKQPSWERAYVDVAVDTDTRSIAACVHAAEQLHREHRVDAVITFAEYSVPAVAAIAQALGLPFVSEETAYISRNKFEMRKAFADAGLPGPCAELARTCADAEHMADQMGYPVVLKPMIGGGSFHIRRINSSEEMRKHFPSLQAEAWKHFSFDPLYQTTRAQYGEALLIESFLPGGEISVESIVDDGVTHTIAIHDKPLPMDGPYFEERYFTTPSRLANSVQDEVRRQTAIANAALGINMGATHTEFRITATGPVLLENAARLGGGPVYRSVLQSTGVDMVQALIDVALKRRPSLKPRSARATGFVCLFAQHEGRFEKLHVQYSPQWDQSVVEIEMYTARGDYLTLPPNGFHAHGHVVIAADALADIDAVANRVVEHIDIGTAHDELAA
jgi:biotin carboxylase